MKQPAADEFMRMQCHDGGLAGGAGGPEQEGVASGVVADEALGGERAALDVAGEVAQGGGEGLIECGMLVPEGVVRPAAEAGGEWRVVDEEVVLGGAVEGLMFGVESGGDDEADVGVVLDLAAPGVQDAGDAEFGSAGLGGADVLEGGGALAENEWIGNFGMDEAEMARFPRGG